MNVEISVIVPVYNVEKYLEKCVDSILGQTYKNIEVILVDDASPDRCPQICDQYAERDKRVRVIHREKNGGLSVARNTGIGVAKGKWISFVDSDDWISSDMLYSLHRMAIRYNAQIVICDFFRVYEDGRDTGESFGKFKNGIFSYRDIVCKFAGDENIWYTVMFGKLFDRRLFKNIQFPENKINEDVFVTLKLFKQCNRVCAVSHKLYYYVSRNNSIMHRYTIQALDGVEAVYNIFNDFYREKWLDLLPGVEKLLFARLTTVYRGLSGKDRKQTRVKEMLQCSKECVEILRKEKRLSFPSRIRTGLFYLFPAAFYIVENCYSRIKGHIDEK